MRREYFSTSLRFPVVKWIILLNILVFFFWRIAGRDGFIFMENNFLVSWQSCVEGRVWTILTSVFSHNMFLHIFVNMYVFFGFGMVMENLLGPFKFLKFYLLAGITSSLSHSVVSAWIMGEPELPALGASGAISGVVMCYCLLFPKRKILLLGIIPIPAIMGIFLVVGLDLWGLFAQARGGGLPIGHGAHLGGALYGALYYFFFLKKVRI